MTVMIHLWYWELCVINILFVYFPVVVVVVVVGKVVMYNFMVWRMVHMNTWRK